MFGQIALTAAAILPLALGAPTTATKRADSNTLSCVQYQYGGATSPFESFGAGGFIHLYANITQFHPETQTTSFNETRLGVAEDRTIQNCGDCRTTELFGFEVCQATVNRYGFDGLGNGPHTFYGHLVWRNYTPDIQCLTVASTNNTVEGSALTIEPCQYDYENAGKSGQYFHMTVTDDVWAAHLVDDNNGVYGPSPALNNNGSLTLYDINGANKTFTKFGFKAPTY
ncbi:hypothetical protein IAT38_001570 [Cryptococcus sp. DSM 104549]